MSYLGDSCPGRHDAPGGPVVVGGDWACHVVGYERHPPLLRIGDRQQRGLGHDRERVELEQSGPVMRGHDGVQLRHVGVVQISFEGECDRREAAYHTGDTRLERDRDRAVLDLHPDLVDRHHVVDGVGERVCENFGHLDIRYELDKNFACEAIELQGASPRRSQRCNTDDIPLKYGKLVLTNNRVGSLCDIAVVAKSDGTQKRNETRAGIPVEQRPRLRPAVVGVADRDFPLGEDSTIRQKRQVAATRKMLDER